MEIKKHVRTTTVAFMALAMLATGGAQAAKKVTITVWHPLLGGELGKNIRSIVSQFEAANPGIAVNIIQSDVDGEKFLTTMAAGSPPDVIFPDGPDVVQWAYKGLLTSLDKRIKLSKLKTDSFFSPAYKQCLWKGQAYALPWIADPNFPVLYKKSVFNEVGLSGAPRTFDEIELFASKLNQRDAAGNYKRLGWWPWDIYGHDNTIFTLGWAFGASFFDEKTMKVSFNNPKALKAMNWLFEFGSRNEYIKAESFRTKNNDNALIKGKLGFAPVVAGIVRDIDKAKLSINDFGWGYFPGSDADGKSAWLGGWTAAIPSNAKRPDEAWKFIKFFCSDKEGADAAYKLTGFLPAVRTADVFSNPEPRFRPWTEVMKIAKEHRPVMPAMPIVGSEAQRLLPLMMQGKKTPAQAMDEMTAQVQKELDRVLKRGKK